MPIHRKQSSSSNGSNRQQLPQPKTNRHAMPCYYRYNNENGNLIWRIFTGIEVGNGCVKDRRLLFLFPFCSFLSLFPPRNNSYGLFFSRFLFLIQSTNNVNYQEASPQKESGEGALLLSHRRPSICFYQSHLCVLPPEEADQCMCHLGGDGDQRARTS